MKSHINETHFELYSRNYSEPDRVKGLWFVIWMCFLEYFLLWLEKKPLPHPKENILSVCHGIFYYLIKVWIRSTEYFAYIWLWENYSLFPMWFSESWSSFFGTVIFVDFCYYWFHRFSHEVMLFWAIHQVHHLSLDLTVSVGIRHSPIQSLFSWVFYLPLAIIGLPVSHLKAHLHVNHMYQIWVHTEAVDKIGPLEWVMNTPSHHRVHHGIIERVIDKNYGGIFIIWDRLFGTFTPEENRDDNIYGVLNQTQSWNIFSQQIILPPTCNRKSKTMSNGLEFFNTFWKGPSWSLDILALGGN
ncbi:Alkylglycerol monooxygenase [Armadillidium vulgare]|nr:Alkylglycerol monooxygenase [Armadillidium vulgare]